MPSSPFSVHESHGYRFLDEGPRSSLPPVVLLHGMLGDLNNWTPTVATLSAQAYRVLVPELPVYDLPLTKTSVRGLVQYLHDFLQAVHPGPIVLAGNSLGGHVAILYALDYPDQISALVLSGASGIYEVELGSSMMRRQDREFIRERAAITFFSPDHATDELVEEVYGIVNDRGRALRLIRMARSVQSESVVDRLSQINVPTLLVWGRDDVITPPDVAETFSRHIPNAELHFIDRCGHAPMIEQPERFNTRMLAFLRHTLGTRAMAVSS